MTTRFTAVVEHGLLRPTEPISLQDGETVEVVLIHPDNGRPSGDPAKILGEIAATPMEPGGLEFSGRDHDRILYGDRG